MRNLSFNGMGNLGNMQRGMSMQGGNMPMQGANMQSMNPMAVLFQMKRQGYTDDQILDQMAQNNPQMQTAIQQMRQEGLTADQYAEKISRQNGMSTQQYFQHLAQKQGMQVPPMFFRQ